MSVGVLAMLAALEAGLVGLSGSRERSLGLRPIDRDSNNNGIADSNEEEVKKLARREGISIDQLVGTAVAEKLAALMTEEHLEKCARRGRKQKFQRVLRKVRSIPAAEDERLGALSLSSGCPTPSGLAP